MFRRCQTSRTSANKLRGSRLPLCLSLVCLGLVTFAGCPVAPSAQEDFDAAVKQMNEEQARLDALRPAFDAARQAAAIEVCKELTGVTPDEAQSAALEGLQQTLSGLNEKAKEANEDNQGDINATINNLVAGEGAVAEQSKALFTGATKVGAVMKNMNTPGTPEAKRLEEAFHSKPEVQAYQRQEERLATAKQAMLDAEAKLPAKSGA